MAPRQCFSPRTLSVRAHAAQTAKQGDFVAVDYTGTLDDGTVFDTSRQEGRQPLEFVVGGGMVSRQGASARECMRHSSGVWLHMTDVRH